MPASRARTLAVSVAALAIVVLVALWNLTRRADTASPPPAPQREEPKAEPPQAPLPAPPTPACRVKVTSAPWSKRGQPPSGAGVVGWLDGQLVEIDQDTRAVTAHVFDPIKDTWRAARLPGVDPMLTYALASTSTAAVYAPVPYREVDGSVGGVFDPKAGSWRQPAPRFPLQGRHNYGTVSSDHWVLFDSNNFRNSPTTQRLLFNPETRELIEVPAPPFSDPRANAVVALDDDNLVVWGGFQGDDSHYAARLFDDGAVFRIKERRWESIPKGPSARSEPVFDLHDGKLMIFGGVDAIRSEQQPIWPKESRDDLVSDAYVLDLASLRWESVAYNWHHWSRRSGPDLAPCWDCSGQLRLRGGSFFARGLLYDAKTQTIGTVTPAATPKSWVQPAGGVPEVPEALALDDDHVIMVLRGVPEALVLDLRTRSWCNTTVPVGSFDVEGEDSAFYKLNTSAHDDRLYFWRSSSSHMVLGLGPSDAVVTPSWGVVVTFAWE